MWHTTLPATFAELVGALAWGQHIGSHMVLRQGSVTLAHAHRGRDDTMQRQASTPVAPGDRRRHVEPSPLHSHPPVPTPTLNSKRSL